MDEKLLTAVISAGSGLIGALIGGGVAVLTAKAATERELWKERLSRSHALTLEKLVPEVLEPMLTQYREAHNKAVYSGSAPEWPLSWLQELLESKRFLVLMAPVSIRHVLETLEAHLGYPDEDSRVKLIRQDLQLLEKVVVDAFSSYRLGETKSE